MITQTNDVAHHKEVRHQFIDLQSAKMLDKTRTQGGGLVECTPEENLEIMTKVMSNKDLHLKAARAYKHIGTTHALGGTEDDMIAGDAKTFWDELNMRPIIKREVDEVERRWIAEEIKWDFKAVVSFITPHPQARRNG